MLNGIFIIFLVSKNLPNHWQRHFTRLFTRCHASWDSICLVYL